MIPLILSDVENWTFFEEEVCKNFAEWENEVKTKMNLQVFRSDKKCCVYAKLWTSKVQRKATQDRDRIRILMTIDYVNRLRTQNELYQ